MKGQIQWEIDVSLLMIILWIVMTGTEHDDDDNLYRAYKHIIKEFSCSVVSVR